jgi:hypothetical protein
LRLVNIANAGKMGIHVEGARVRLSLGTNDLVPPPRQRQGAASVRADTTPS